MFAKRSPVNEIGNDDANAQADGLNSTSTKLCLHQNYRHNPDIILQASEAAEIFPVTALPFELQLSILGYCMRWDNAGPRGIPLNPEWLVPAERLLPCLPRAASDSSYLLYEPEPGWEMDEREPTLRLSSLLLEDDTPWSENDMRKWQFDMATALGLPAVLLKASAPWAIEAEKAFWASNQFFVKGDFYFLPAVLAKVPVQYLRMIRHLVLHSTLPQDDAGDESLLYDSLHEDEIPKSIERNFEFEIQRSGFATNLIDELDIMHCLHVLELVCKPSPITHVKILLTDNETDHRLKRYEHLPASACSPERANENDPHVIANRPSRFSLWKRYVYESSPNRMAVKAGAWKMFCSALEARINEFSRVSLLTAYRLTLFRQVGTVWGPKTTLRG